MRENDTPKIYVACLAAYNAGILHGCWIDAAQDVEDIWREVRQMLAASPEPNSEEWAIHDYDGFGELHLSEFESLDRVHSLALSISEFGALATAVLANFNGNIEETEEAFENYRGCYNSLADYAAELTEDTVEIPDCLVHYIDYDAMGRDMELNGDLFTITTKCGGVHVFWAH